MGQFAAFQVDQHVAAQQSVVEDKVDEEVAAVEAEALLARLEQEALAEFQQELLKPVDDRGLQVVLGVGRLLLEDPGTRAPPGP